MVLKPSEITPLSTLRAAEIMADVLPPGVVNVIHGAGASIGDQLINSPEMEAISVTGSPGTGAAAMQAGSRKLRHVHLELGGKAPVIVFDDADLDAVVETIRGGSYFNAGQDCAQPTRLLVQDSVYDRVVADLASAVASIKLGSQREEGVEMGPLVTAQCGPRAAPSRETAGATMALPSHPAATRPPTSVKPTICAGALPPKPGPAMSQPVNTTSS